MVNAIAHSLIESGRSLSASAERKGGFNPKGEDTSHSNPFDMALAEEQEEFFVFSGSQMSPSQSHRKGYDLDPEIERLHHSIDSLTEAVSGLNRDVSHQAEKVEQIGERRASDFKELLTKIYDHYKELITLQAEAFRGFGDRLDTLLTRQEEQAAAIRGEMKTDFARIVDRQDSHFRWLVGLVIASAISIGIAVYKAH